MVVLDFLYDFPAVTWADDYALTRCTHFVPIDSQFRFPDCWYSFWPFSTFIVPTMLRRSDRVLIAPLARARVTPTKKKNYSL